MRNRIGWLAWLLTLVGLLAPALARAQENGNYEVPPAPGSDYFPYPLGHPRYEEGGIYGFGEFVMWSMRNPLKSQPVAFQGFVDRDGTIAASLNTNTGSNLPILAGQFIGSHALALDVSQLNGTSTYMPGFNVGMGYRFKDGVAVEASWIHLWEAKYSATASLQPPGLPGANQENTFLFSPVFNYPTDYFGPGQKINAPGSNFDAASGLWNGATLMTIEFIQRFDQWQIGGRVPIMDTADWRTYGLLGGRLAWFWERFKWRTVDQNLAGQSNADDVAYYVNVVSNRLWGAYVGFGNECRLGTTPVGEFAISLDLDGAAFFDFVSTEAKYYIGDFHTAASRHAHQVAPSGEVSGKLALWWYPYEAIQVRVGYTGMVFFNTYASPRPIDYNYGQLAPSWEHNIVRWVQGVDVGIAFIF
jgi:hypothetical protein